MSLLDLPFESGEPPHDYDKAKLTITAVSPLIVFHEQVREVSAAEVESPILVSQDFFKRGDRYQQVDGERQDKFVSDEFIVHAVYGCQSRDDQSFFVAAATSKC